MLKDELEIPAEKCYWQCDLSGFQFESTDQLEQAPTILGQERAVRAIQLGLSMNFPGYNIFVAGEPGTGRSTTVRFLLRDVYPYRPTPNDVAYVYNFQKPDMPLALRMPPGKGSQFRRLMESFVENLRQGLPQMFESDRYRARRQKIIDEFNDNSQKLFAALDKKATKANFTVVQIQMGPMVKPDVLPLLDGQPTSFEQLEAMQHEGKFDEAQLNKMVALQKKLTRELKKIIEKNQKLSRKMRDDLDALDRTLALQYLNETMQEMRQNLSEPVIHLYLDAVGEDILDNLSFFKEKSEGDEASSPRSLARNPLPAYRVNLVVDNSHTEGAPIIFENLPTMSKLFGTIEQTINSEGQWFSDFSTIRAGSLLTANGGYLVCDARDLLSEAGVWTNLKRVLKTRKLEIWALETPWGGGASAIKPEPIDINLKLILIGDPTLYHLLYNADADFMKIFKIKAEFDYEIKNNSQSVLKYGIFIQRLCKEEDLLPFDRSGLARVVEAGARLSGDQTKLSTRFNHIADIVRESAFYARQDLAKFVNQGHVDRTLQERRMRRNLSEDKVREMIERDVLMIDTQGFKIGQVNGLSVYDMGDYAFGKPSRITAQTAVGRSGIVNIEREVELSGPTHDKGVLILTAFLQHAFSQNKPLALSASLCFEQSYNEVDGDSASSAELYALLSRLAKVPIDQGLAVTGSINQNGEIQPIGGVNEKIEGFFSLCEARGLTDKQGVILPRRNVQDLMLHQKVTSAIAAGKFHLYAIDHIVQGIELLTGSAAGTVDENGLYPEESIFGRADRTCRDYVEYLRSCSAVQMA